MTDPEEKLLLELSQRLLDSIAKGDWSTYAELCDPSLTAFEPEARGHLVEGMEFHEFYFKGSTPRVVCNTTISSPHIRLLGDVAVVSYVRLLQREIEAGHETSRYEETRVWQRVNGTWRHVHFHRSANP